jgi:hypothetical protein
MKGTRSITVELDGALTPRSIGLMGRSNCAPVPLAVAGGAKLLGLSRHAAC